MITVILLSGWKRSGKDTAAHYLEESYNIKRFALADPLKEFVCSKYNMDMSYFSDAKKDKWLPMKPVLPSQDKFSVIVKEFLIDEFVTSGQAGDHNKYFTPRTLAILEGSLMRVINPNHWVDTLHKKIIDSGQQTVVISDWRLINEYERLCYLFGESNIVTIRVNRFEDIETKNETERQLDNFNFKHTIANTGSLDALFTELDIVINKEFGGGK